MGNDLFLSKIESNDEILEGNAVDSFVYYTTAYRKQIDKYFMLKDVRCLFLQLISCLLIIKIMKRRENLSII